MKKILILGASHPQLPLILSAKRLGLHVITCDNIPSSPGHAIASESHNVSTLDRQGVLDLARRCKVDGVLCAGDMAAPIVAWVCEQLGLPTHPSDSVEILCNKDRFRNFLSENGFRTPKAVGFHESEISSIHLQEFKYPVIVKPVDSSASRGVSQVDLPAGLETATRNALRHSRLKKIIVEEFIEPSGVAISGDGFSIDGRLVYRLYCNDLRDPVAPFYSAFVSVPCLHTEEIQSNIDKEIQRAFELLKLKSGTYNFDVRVQSDGLPVLMEIAPRAGGCSIPHLAKLSTGVDLTEASILAAIGQECKMVGPASGKRFLASYQISSLVQGVFRALEIDPEFLEKHVREIKICVQPGEAILGYTGVEGVIGELILEFDSGEQQMDTFANIRKFVQVKTEESRGCGAERTPIVISS
ncbi:MAG: ATP-grasp domain-containing protein [Fibrobacteres bacterium]|nr:ATP-grasp domain-containing protein [Fibrobacterota bacterium]